MVDQGQFSTSVPEESPGIDPSAIETLPGVTGASATGAPAETGVPAETAAPAETGAPAETEEGTLTQTEPAPPAEAPAPFLTSLGFSLGMAGLAAAMTLCALGLFIANRRLARKKKESAPAAAPAPGPVTGVRVGKLHAQGAREYQQDNFGVSDVSLLSDYGILAVVADGMGGLAEGDKVSTAAVSAALDTFMLMQGQGTPEQILLTLTQRAETAVNALLGPENYRKSGTTLIMGMIRDSAFSFVSVGDSHIYLLRDGVLTLLNREHIFKNDLAVRGVNDEIPLPDAYKDELGGGLTSYVGMGKLKYIDIPAEPVEALPGDKFILMSDGVYNALERSELLEALAGEPEEAAAELGRRIEAKGYTNQDNYTAVILACAGGEQAE